MYGGLLRVVFFFMGGTQKKVICRRPSGKWQHHRSAVGRWRDALDCPRRQKRAAHGRAELLPAVAKRHEGPMARTFPKNDGLQRYLVTSLLGTVCTWLGNNQKVSYGVRSFLKDTEF